MQWAPSSRLRAGFTLVELLVVIAIIGVLVALLLPAVQAAREAARRSTCTNNLRQLALALHNHHDVRGALPPGSMYFGLCCTPPAYTNWAIEILPYMEQQNLYQQYRQNELNVSTNNNLVGQQRLKTHECPSDSIKGKLEVPSTGPRPGGQQWMHGSYRAVSGKLNLVRGHGNWDGFEPQLWPDNMNDHQYKSFLHAIGVGYNGVASPNVTHSSGTHISSMGGPERFASATDGLSNTLMIGEYTTRSAETTAKGTFWAYTYASYNQSSVGAESRLYGLHYGNRATDPRTCWGTPGLYGDQSCKRSFNSEHPSGANWALGDASVRFINYNVDVNLLQNMGTMAGGESAVVP
jgi:prepilin-type N-terminal cleavage/methylation domain-containing protein